LEEHKAIALIMAAGSSRRFGSDKRLAKLSTGETILAQTVKNIAAANLDYKIAIAAKDKVYFSQFYSADTLLLIEHSQQGIGQSIAEAIDSIKNNYPHCLICLADMPYILPSTYQAIANAIHHYDAVIPNYNGNKGNPVAISSSLYKPFSLLSEDKGGRDILKNKTINLHSLDVEDPGVLRDIDLLSDL
jgi:molybdenum cofactor cytidylyltransferase